MNFLDIWWLSAQGAAFVMLLIVTLVFCSQEGRAKIYVSGILAAFTIHALTSLLTSTQTEVSADWAFKAPRTASWIVISGAALAMILYQLKIINGKKSERP